MLDDGAQDLDGGVVAVDRGVIIVGRDQLEGLEAVGAYLERAILTNEYTLPLHITPPQSYLAPAAPADRR